MQGIPENSESTVKEGCIFTLETDSTGSILATSNGNLTSMTFCRRILDFYFWYKSAEIQKND